MVWSTWPRRSIYTETWLLGTACKYIGSVFESACHDDIVNRKVCTLCSVFTRIDSCLVIKITDFGLAEDVFVKDYFRQGTTDEIVKLPVKWMAPESLSDGHFSEKSDVVQSFEGDTIL